MPQGGLLPGMAMQLAQSQYFAPGTGQGVNMAGQRQQAPAAAPERPPGGEWVHAGLMGWGGTSRPSRPSRGQSVADAYLAHQQGMNPGR